MPAQATLEAFKARLRGELLQANDTGYETARKVYNGMIDRHPRLIVRCANVADVIAAVHFARDNDMPVAVRGGGHNWTKTYWEALHPYSAGGAYVNFMMDEGAERVKATYRDNYERLVTLKNMYDPTNLFRVNQNIKPTV